MFSVLEVLMLKKKVQFHGSSDNWNCHEVSYEMVLCQREVLPIYLNEGFFPVPKELIIFICHFSIVGVGPLWIAAFSAWIGSTVLGGVYCPE